MNKVLVLIVEAKGKNDLVETKRGKKWASLDLPIDLTNEDDTVDVPESSSFELSEEEPDLVEEEEA